MFFIAYNNVILIWLNPLLFASYMQPIIINPIMHIMNLQYLIYNSVPPIKFMVWPIIHVKLENTLLFVLLHIV